MASLFKSRRAKVLLIVGKCLIACALLAWALGQVRWDDWVRDKDGRTYALRAAPKTPADHFRLVDGRFWNQREVSLPADRLEPLPAPADAPPAYVHDGLAGSLLKVGSRGGVMAAAVLITLVSYFVTAARWRLLLQMQEIHIGHWESARLTFLGMFFSIIVPGTVGGDLVKAYYAAQHAPHKGSVLVSVIVDRILGLLTLTLLAAGMLGAVLAFLPRKPEIVQAGWTVLIVGGAVCAGMLVLFSSRVRRLLHLQKLYAHLPIAQRIAAMGQAVRVYRARPGVMLAVVGISLVSHVMWIGGLGLVGYCLCLNVPWYEYYLYIPLIYTIGAVPLTPGGVGLIEKLFVVFFTASVANNPSQVLALALLARLLPMVLSLPGLVVAVTGPKIPPRDVLAAELQEPACPPPR